MWGEKKNQQEKYHPETTETSTTTENEEVQTPASKIYADMIK